MDETSIPLQHLKKRLLLYWKICTEALALSLLVQNPPPIFFLFWKPTPRQKIWNLWGIQHCGKLRKFTHFCFRELTTHSLLYKFVEISWKQITLIEEHGGIEDKGASIKYSLFSGKKGKKGKECGSFAAS